MATTKVSAKGAVVIPMDIRRKYGIESGMMVNITDVNGSIKIMPLPQDPIAAAHGLLKKGKGKSLTDILLEERKKDLAKEEAQIAVFVEKEDAGS